MRLTVPATLDSATASRDLPLVDWLSLFDSWDASAPVFGETQADAAAPASPAEPDGVPGATLVTSVTSAPNVAPIIDLNGAATGKGATIGYTIGAAAVAIAPGATVTNSDSATLIGGTLAVSLAGTFSTADRLTIENQGVAAGQIGTSGANVTYGGTVIGTVSVAANGATLSVLFNAASTPAAAQTLAEHILFSSTAGDAAQLARTVVFSLYDGGGTAGGGVDHDSATATIYAAKAAVPFTPGDVVIYRAGDGSAALSTNAAAVYLDEYTRSGTLVQSILLPVADSGANQMLTTSGTGATSGVLGRSVDYRYLLLAGFDAAPGTTSVISTQASTVNRIVGRVDITGAVDTATALTNAYSADNIRSVVSVDGSSFYIAGGPSAIGRGGIQTASFHGTTSTQVAFGDFRSITIDAGQLYADTATDLQAFASTLPGGASGSLGVALTGAHEYLLLDRDASVAGVDTLYVAEDTALLKFGLVGGVWTAEGSIAVGMTGLDATVSSTGVTFFATTATTAAATSGNALVTFTDIAAYNAPISATGVTTLATAAANTAFRGLSFTPTAPTISIFSPQQVHFGSGTTGQTGGTYTFDIYRESAASSATVNYTFTSDGQEILSNASGTATFSGGSLRTTITTTATFSRATGDASFTLTLSNPSAGYVVAGGSQTTIIAGQANVAPVVDLNGAAAAGTSAALTYTQGSAATAITPAATVTDATSSEFKGGSLTVAFTANGAATDQLTIENQGNAAGKIGVSGTTVSYGGAALGTFSGGTNGTALVITFSTTGAATPQSAQALIEHILYSNTSPTPGTAARTITYTLVDGDGTVGGGFDTGTATATITFNTAPMLGNAGHVTSYVGYAAPVAIEPGLTLSDDTANQASATATISAGFQGGDVLAATTTGTAITASYDPATHVLTLSGTDTIAHYQQVLDSITFANTSNPDPTAGGTAASRTISFTTNDGSLASAAVTSTVTVIANGFPTAVADTAATTEAAAITIAVLANDTDTDGGPKAVATVNGVALSSGSTTMLASGAVVTLNPDGTLGYDPHGAFAYLNAQSSTLERFAYTLNGGSSATVAVTVTGIDSGAVDQNHGSAGDDVIVGSGYVDASQGGVDVVTGSAANDGFYFGSVFKGADRVDGGGGANDQIGLKGDYTGGNALVLQAATITGVEVIAAQAGFSYDITTVDANVAAGQTLTVYGSSLAAGNALTFNGAAETDGGMFRVYGGMGADNIVTGAGDDGIYFGAGRFDVATDHVDGRGGSNDQLALDGSYTVTIARANVVNIEVLALLDGQAAPATYAITLADDWTTGSEVHSVYAVGVRNAVTVDGHFETTSQLKFWGGNGADTLIGGSAGNWFDGGAGGDTMTGGAGVDTYFYGTAANSSGVTHDTIVNFDPTMDKIDLPFAVAAIDAPRSGALSTASFDLDLKAALATLDAHHAVQFTASGGDLTGHVFEIIDANGVAGYQAGQDYVIELTNTSGGSGYGPLGGPVTDPGVFG